MMYGFTMFDYVKLFRECMIVSVRGAVLVDCDEFVFFIVPKGFCGSITFAAGHRVFQVTTA